MLASLGVSVKSSIPQGKIEHEPSGMQFANPFYRKREIMKLPPSAKFILFVLKAKGAMNRKRIIQETLMPDRTVGFALKLLLDKKIIQKEDPELLIKRTSEKKRRRRKRDRRVTNYNVISAVLPFEMVEA